MSFPNDHATASLAMRLGMDPMEAYLWRILCGHRYEETLELVYRTVSFYLSVGVPREYVLAVTSIDHKTCGPVAHATKVADLYRGGVLPSYVTACRGFAPDSIVRLARAGVPYEMVKPGSRPSEFASVLITLYHHGVSADYAKALLDAGHTTETVVGLWNAGIPLEYAPEAPR